MAARKRHDDNVITRLWCQLGMVVSWFVAVGSLVGGGICLYFQLRDGNSVYFITSRTWRELIPLILNVVVTLLNDSMGYIHNCSLRWALQREGKLEFSSNLRLLTFSKLNRPNAWYSNFIYLFGIVLSYSSTSLIFLSLDPSLAHIIYGTTALNDPMNPNEIHVSAVALLTFGLGVMCQASITNWAFLTPESITTWSSNPLDVVKECLDQHNGHRIHRQQGRCMMSVHEEAKPPGVRKPEFHQRAMFWAHRSVRWVFYLHWALPFLGALWGVVIYVMILKGNRNGIMGRSWSLLPVFTGSTDNACGGSVHACTDGTSILNIGWTASNGPVSNVGSIFLITGFQAIVTLSLHCAELIVNLSRDEGVYRKLIHHKGTNGHYNSIWAACTSWQTIFLFGLKAGVHWMFGLAINVSFGLGVNMYPPQIFYFSALSLLAALFATYLAFRRPSGFLPAAFGHVQTTADIIDEWIDSGCMFWGHKASGEPSYAGTSYRHLDDPDPRYWYGGPDRLTTVEQAYQLGYQAASQDNLSRARRNPQGSPNIGGSDHGSQWNNSRPSMTSMNSRYSNNSNESAQTLMHWQY